MSQADAAGLRLYALKKGLADMKANPVFTEHQKSQYTEIILVGLGAWLLVAQPDPTRN